MGGNSALNLDAVATSGSHRGFGNVDPRKSIRQAAVIRFVGAGATWLSEGLENRFRGFGKLSGGKLEFD